ncbi:hypothetical protein T03_1484 [Trichinella britovi]|uniref:Uncharacterized protein n=1 Tax=Trichinella britovi TaxID=45882 RepID=A0A0V1D7E7_TRIBR|nr:hypothetical protein T09_3868 [Trichinella sp. T9]KRY57453.1 hypothetical protein T03_1484 [Trichinella britovi]
MELPYYGILEKAFHLALQHMQWKHNLLKIKNSFSISSHNYCRNVKKNLHGIRVFCTFSLIPYHHLNILRLCSIDRANLSNELCFALLWLALAVLHAVNARMTSPD